MIGTQSTPRILDSATFERLVISKLPWIRMALSNPVWGTFMTIFGSALKQIGCGSVYNRHSESKGEIPRNPGGLQLLGMKEVAASRLESVGGGNFRCGHRNGRELNSGCGVYDPC